MQVTRWDTGGTVGKWLAHRVLFFVWNLGVPIWTQDRRFLQGGRTSLFPPPLFLLPHRTALHWLRVRFPFLPSPALSILSWKTRTPSWGPKNWCFLAGKMLIQKMRAKSLHLCPNQKINTVNARTSLTVQWLKLCAPSTGSQVPSLVGELDPVCSN